MTSISSGGGGGYDYVETFYPSDAEEGESLYHLTEDAAYVYTGTEWTEQTVTDHGQLSGVSEGDHRSDGRVSDLAPVQSVDGETGNVTAIPSGVITMWSGSTSDVPNGWTLCDGSGGAPDLRDRFVVGAGGQYSPGSKGGTNSVQLSESEMPAHDHSYSRTTDVDPGDLDVDYDSGGGKSVYENGTTDTAGDNQSHENRPPYYGLAFIMKV